MSGLFEGQRVFITGASSGIGAAMAREFARQGAKVILAARRLERLESLKQEIEEAGGQALCVVCDVTSRAALDDAVAAAVEHFGGIDVVVANAGFGVSGPLENLSTGDYRRQFETNVFGVIDTIYAVLPHLKASRGRLGIVSSVLGRLGTPTTSAYCASKFALCGLAESIYYELADHGVSVTSIEPGVVATDFRRVDNQGVFHPDAGEAAPPWLLVPSDVAARAIVRALHSRKVRAVITRHGKVFVWISRHFPRLLRLLVRRSTKGRLDEVEGWKRDKDAR